jgi:hypothetical protein
MSDNNQTNTAPATQQNFINLLGGLIKIILNITIAACNCYLSIIQALIGLILTVKNGKTTTITLSKGVKVVVLFLTAAYLWGAVVSTNPPTKPDFTDLAPTPAQAAPAPATTKVELMANKMELPAPTPAPAPATPTHPGIGDKKIPQKWESHKEYVADKLKNDPSFSGLITKFKTQATEYKFYAATPCHPYILGAVHYRETGLRLNNGWNGQGAFQNVSNKYPANSPTTDATKQATQACDHLKGKAKNFCQKYGTAEDLNSLDNIELLGCSLAAYNGCNGKHYNNCGYTVNGLSKDQEHFMKCSVDFVCLPLVKESQFGTLTFILGALLQE